MLETFSPGSTPGMTPRRGFLATVAAAGATLGLTAVRPSHVQAEAGSGRPPSVGSGASADPAFEAWLARIAGPHRQVFDAPHPNEGLPGIYPRVYLETMKATYPDQQITAVVILRHSALGLAFNDAIWSKYRIGEQIGVKDGSAPATRNVFATIEELGIPGLGIAELLKSGVLVGVCNVALTLQSAGAAKRMGLDAAAVKKEWTDGVLSGIQIVPSGVMAIGRAQEMRCTYCYAG